MTEMAIDEPTRYRLHQRLDEVLGRDEAAALMACLPPLGWGDVATKADLRSGLELTEQRILATMRAEMNAQTRTLMLGFLGANLSFAALVLAIVKLG